MQNPEEASIVTGSIKDVIVDSLKSTNAYLPQLVTGIEKSAALLKEDNVNEGMTLLQQCVTGLGGFAEIIDKSSQLVAGAISPSVMTDLPILDKRMALNQVLNKLVEKLTAGDFLVVSDLLEAELIPEIKEWMILLPQMVGRIENGLN